MALPPPIPGQALILARIWERGTSKMATTIRWGRPRGPVRFMARRSRRALASRGLQGGFNWQSPNSNWVLGLEASISATDARASNTCLTVDAFITSANCGNSLHSVGSVVGRGGMAFGGDNRFLAYGKAGIGYVNLNTTQMTNYDGGRPALTVRSINDRALVLGGGLEYALSRAFSVSLDYTHYGLQSYQLPTSYAVNGRQLSMTFKPTYDVVRLGVNYHMGADAGPLGSDPALVSAAASPLTFEIGMRYWYSIGKFQKDLAVDGSNSTSLVSRLTYQNKSSSGESSARSRAKMPSCAAPSRMVA